MQFPLMSHSCRPQTAATRDAADWSIHSIGAYPPGTGKARGVWFRAVFTGLLSVALTLAAGCTREPPEAALRATIAGMQAAAEGRDADALVEAVSEEFVGPGGMDRDQFRRTMALAWLRDRNVGVQLGPLDVELLGDRARVEFTAGTTGGAGWLPERGQLHQVKTAWRLEGGDWKLISATWSPVL
jgi:hypothetical protein